MTTTILPTQNPAIAEPTRKTNKLSILALIFIIYFEVSGGPFGEEEAVKGGGPLLAILGFVVFPFIWSIPEALITAELATAYPGNGGYVIWVDRAFGPFWASLMASWKFSSGAINNAAYPVLCTDYLKVVFPLVKDGLPRGLAICFFTLILSFINYTGLTIVGYGAVALGVISVCPFFIMGIMSIGKIRPRRWISMGQKDVKRDWSLFLNTLFWNLNYWDNASTLAGEVENPRKTYPKALSIAGIFTCVCYIIPLLAAVGAIELDQNRWDNGYLAVAAGIIGGKWLRIWVEVGAALSTVGLFEAQLSSSAFQLLGMAELGFLPCFFALRSTWFNTPWVGILLSSIITLALAYIPFTDIINAANLIYAFSMILEFAAFIYLRRKYPDLVRPFRVPLGNVGVVIMCVVPTVFLVFVMVLTTRLAYVYAGGFTVLSALVYFLNELCKSRGWVKYNDLIEEGEAGEIVNL